ncbi:activator of stress genes 1 [Chaetomidium leptoderma]|uniref:Activator of stress genes 1 n=1 Tax=Chaetomidium leptoderma TaxID=669021 RepID=A0AAN6VLQ0_9PEZI|nr:activator of stress genes 1 [Chaetomidium leptoderma]
METPQHTFVPETGQPSQRRRKARLACNSCRARKTGCDGRKPVCSACSLRGWEDKCGYPDSVMQQSTALTLVELDQRLLKLEYDARADLNAPRKPAPDGGALSPASTSGPAAAGPGDDRGLSPTVDALATDKPTTASTNSIFMRQGLEAARHSHDPSESPTSELESPTFPDLVGFAMPALGNPLDAVDPRAMVLPQRQLADALLRDYWQNFHSVFPFLHWFMFETKYCFIWKEKAAPSEAFEELLFYATLNMVLALGCLRNETIPPGQRQYYANEFYKRSIQLISAETLDASSIPIVQLLLLRAMYTYFAGRADRCWLASGAAVRVAIGLGFQLHATPKRQLSQLEREMHRRVWYGGCVCLDQVLSSTFGRPGMIFPGLTQTPLPLDIDEEYLSTTEEGTQPPGIPSRMDMVLYSVKILVVLEEMRAAQRAPRLKLDQSSDEFTVPDPGAVLSVDSKIEDLLNGLPHHLRPDADLSNMSLNEDTIKFFRVQSHAVRFRMLLLRVFLLRPSLLAEAERWTTRNTSAPQPASLVLQERFHHELCTLCLTTVHSVLEEIHKDLATSGGMSAWYALHFTFASATVLLVATLSPKLGVSLETEPTKSSWARAMAILDAHKTHVASAARGMEVLRRYRESITLRAGARTGSISSSVQGIPHISLYPPPPPQGGHDHQPQQQQTQQQTQQQQYGQPQQQQQAWDQSQAMPTPPPMAGMGMMEGLDGLLTSDSLDEAWLTNQDFGQGGWMLRD